MANYSYKKFLPNGKTAGVWFFEELSNRLGNNFHTWNTHPDYNLVIQDAHNRIFGNPKPYKKENGLRLHVAYLQRAVKQSRETKKLRASCYNSALMEAMSAGIITQADYNRYSV